MKIKADVLTDHIKRAHIGGLVNEVVLDEQFKFSVTDEGRAVLAVSTEGFQSDIGKIGVFDLAMFLRTVEFVASTVFTGEEEVEIKVVENRLVFKKGDNEFKFLLSKPEVISTTIQNVDEVFKKITAPSSVEFFIHKTEVDACLKAINLINPEVVTIYTQGNKVLALVGKETEHNAVICLAVLGGESKEQTKVLMKPDVLSRVLQVLPADEDAKVELRNSYPLIFRTKKYVFAVAPVKEETE